MVRTLAAFGAILLFLGGTRAAEPDGVRPLRAGDDAYITVPVKHSLAFTTQSLAECQMVVRAMKAYPERWVDIDDLRPPLQSPGAQVKVLEVVAAAPPTLPVSVAKIEFPKRPGALWIPVQYLCPPSEPLPKGEYQLPAIMPYNLPYVPQAGERVNIYNSERKDVPFASDPASYSEYFRRGIARDERGQSAMIADGRIRIEEEDTTAEAVSTLPVAFGNKSIVLVQCRILDGQLKGKTEWFSSYHTKRYSGEINSQSFYDVNVYSRRITRRDTLSESAKRQDRIKTLYDSARNLEKSKRVDHAVKYYRELIEQYPGTPESEKAAQRIEAIGSKPKQ